jgi:hypothetical protein
MECMVHEDYSFKYPQTKFTVRQYSDRHSTLTKGQLNHCPKV